MASGATSEQTERADNTAQVDNSDQAAQADGDAEPLQPSHRSQSPLLPRFSPFTIVIATFNSHKIPEIASALNLPGMRIAFTSLSELGITEGAEETGSRFIENAFIKASHAFARTRLTCLADDSGLEVDALGGEPGVYSARYAGDIASDAENNSKLLKALQNLPASARRARFISEIAMILADGSQLSARGVCAGYIAETPRGQGGFGYDPIFVPDDATDGRSMAELSLEEKNQISHRGRALRQLRQKLIAHYARTRQSENGGKPVELAVFDFDGTLLDGASPVHLVRRLLLQRILPVSVGRQIAYWGLRYKLRLAVDQSEVRSYIFNSLANLTAQQVQALMVDLYQNDLKPLLKPQGLAAVEAARQTGHKIGVVSASFEPIVSALAADLNADFHISTNMEISNGRYTGRLAAIPPEGIGKLIQLRNKADSLYGEGNWSLSQAYGDHYSDEQILSAALHPGAVDPDRLLRSLANQLGWTIYNW